MADNEELRHMILSFRVSELQLLLGFAGRNKTGRKDQLQARALDLLRMRSAPVQMKIKELYKRFPSTQANAKTMSTRSSTPSSSSATTNTTTEHHDSSSKLGYSSSMSNLPHQPVLPNASHLPGPLDYSSSRSYNLPPSSPHHSHLHTQSSNNNYPVHPDVRFKRLPFYEVHAELLKPASLVPSGTTRIQEAAFYFHFTPKQANEICNSRDLRPNAKIEYSVQVQLRFCLAETSCLQDDNFPPSICVKVNGKMCSLPNPIPTNKPGVEPKRPSRPVNITSYCKLTPTLANNINVTWASEYGRGYVVAIYLVKRLTSSALLQNLKSRGIRSADHTRVMIKEKLSHDADSEIATTSLRVSLMCPLGKMRMQIPCRASTCTHLQCFDGSLYLQMNEKKPTWICPVCDKPAPYDTLIIDGLFMEIFNQAPESNEIQFHENGSWSPLMVKKDNVVSSPVVHILSSSSVSVAPPAAPKQSSSGGGASSNKPESDVIDLTLSSDDEDDRPLVPPASSQTDSKAHVLALSGSNFGSVGTEYSSNSTSGSGSNLLAGGSGSSSSSSVTNCSANSSSSSSLNLGRSNAGNSNSFQRNTSSPSFHGVHDISSVLDSNMPSYYPPVSSPFPDILGSSSLHPFLFPGIDFYSPFGSSDVERNILPYSSAPATIPLSSLSSHKSGAPSSSPDVISLD